ncbi:hypothetical protein F5B22DRAFT_613996 [Xylaria bambusicola]|uniref:uncharacterized protein n=1 Tax=Xylaria bambusicola TaxID=326684 RepID=UPI002008C202|nr:uncharacterized protein F5B22DRAFT_613996 [Xylaria bambusicola]KAI0512745.1 hypothetical protein F5B22DRAFT_613996 [Xylaria bambusicola]
MSMRHSVATLLTRALIQHKRPITPVLTRLPFSLSPLRPLSTSAAVNMSSPPTSSSSSAAAEPQSAIPSPHIKGETEEPKLPPLSAHEFREYNRMAEHMDIFHNHFRSTWNMLYTSASSGRRAQGMSMRSFIHAGLEFTQHLEMHHSIEERYVFPELARRMPEFRTGKERNLDHQGGGEEDEGKRKKAAELLQQHVDIHKGMDGLADYLRRCLSGETELQMSVLKTQLDSWGTVLFTHLDQEVRTLGAENMRKYWTLDEIRKMRM